MIICAAAVGLLGANAALLLFRDNNGASCVNIASQNCINIDTLHYAAQCKMGN